MNRTLLIALAACALTACALAACGPSGSKTGKAAAPPAAPAAAVPLTVKAGPMPALPAWAAAYVGQPLASLPLQAGRCVGNTEAVRQRFTGPPAGVEIAGWGWDGGARQGVARVLLVDASQRIVGAGEGGRPRGDVPRALPQVTDIRTGWRALAAAGPGLIQAYGLLDDGRSVCPIGQITL